MKYHLKIVESKITHFRRLQNAHLFSGTVRPEEIREYLILFLYFIIDFILLF